MAFTYANALQFLKDYDRSNQSTQGSRIHGKIINDACMELHRAGKFDFDRRISSVTVAAPYSTGTVSVSVDGTTVTGSGTTFTSSMVGRYLRFNAEPYSYQISAYSSATSITIAEAYHGDTALSGVDYEITNDRVALPSRFRDFEKPVLNAGIYRLNPISLHDMMLLRQTSPSTQTPTEYATEQEESSGVPQKYIWVWPAPSEKMTIQLIYYVWPPEMTADSDTFKVPFEAEGAIREMLIALLKREQGQADWQAQYGIAKSTFMDVVGVSRLVSEDIQREEYWSGNEGYYVPPRYVAPEGV